MSSVNVKTNRSVSHLFQNPLKRSTPGGSGKYVRVRVKELCERDRGRILKHFLGLEKSDRLLRFGTYLPDAQITTYVNQINFKRDAVFGVYSGMFRLNAVGHLAFAPRPVALDKQAATEKDRVAEFGVSVAYPMRGTGVGSKLFERAAIHCRNNDVDTLYMHCLSSNQTMMHIAKKAGMEIQRDYGEADAYLKLPPANPSSILQEAMEEQFATFDYTFKSALRSALKWLGRLFGRSP
ncbi:MAG: RimJ/RimL family protein N-acetyltransferase [Janthinobacterium sp.]|jgi:RimJ/RimL family protein N-acetyltransferase